MTNKKIALVTGGTRGIGLRTVEQLAELGYIVVTNYRSREEPARELKAMAQSRGWDIHIVKADVSNEQDVSALFERIDKLDSSLSILVNNAGELKTQTGFLGISPERLATIFATNVYGAFYCSQQAVQRMALSSGGKGGAIVNLSSVAAKTGSPNEYIDYACAKGAIDTLTIGLSKEYGANGIRVNAVRPGFIKTEIHADGGEANRVERLKSRVPMGRGGLAEEVANTVVFLASDKASYINGATLDVTGGL